MLRDNKGRFVATTVTKTIKTPTKALKKVIFNNIALIIDSSGSMGHCWSTAEAELKKQLAKLKSESKRLKQKTYLTLVNFSDKAETVYSGFIDNYNDERLIYRGQNTALNEAIITTIERLPDSSFFTDKLKPGETLDLAYALVVITDGEENRSGVGYGTIRTAKLIKEKLDSKLWTIAVSGPVGCKAVLSTHYSVPEENILEWENTLAGTKKAFATNSVALTSYTSARSIGSSQVNNFYSLDFSANPVTKDELDDLTEITKITELKVDKESRINERVNQRFGKYSYIKGRWYYELTKSEKVSASKDLILFDKKTKKYYRSGAITVRKLLKLPEYDEVKIDPFNVEHFKVFIQSTSDNRKLVRGTVLVGNK